MAKFSELAYLGDLSIYSLDDLKKKLSRWEFKKTAITSEFIDVKFSEKVVVIDIRYTIEGQFVQILREEWKGIAVFDFNDN
jgi:hypothetical protein